MVPIKREENAIAQKYSDIRTNRPREIPFQIRYETFVLREPPRGIRKQNGQTLFIEDRVNRT